MMNKCTAFSPFFANIKKNAEEPFFMLDYILGISHKDHPFGDEGLEISRFGYVNNL